MERDNERSKLVNNIIALNTETMSEPLVHELIAETPELFKYVKNPSTELEILAVRMLGSNIKYVKDQTPILQKLAILDDVENIKYIDEPIPFVEEKVMNEFPEAIRYLKNPRDQSLLIACTYPGLFKHVKDRSPYICEYAVKKNPENITYISNPSLDLQRIAYLSNPSLLEKLDKVDSGLLMEIIPNNPYIVSTLKNVTDLQYKMALKQEPLVLLQLEDNLLDKYKTYTKSILLDTINGDLSSITTNTIKEYPMLVLVTEYCNEFYTFLDIALSELPDIVKLFPDVVTKQQIPYILSNSGWFIKYFDEDQITDSMAMLALSNNQDYCIQYIKNPSVYVQTYAVEEHANNLQYIKDPHPTAINIAIAKSPFSIKYVDEPSDFICCKAIRKDPNSIQFIKNQTEKMQFIAYKQNEMSAKYFKNPCTNIKIMVLSEHPEYVDNDEFKLTVDDLMNTTLAESPKVLLNSDKQVVLEYLYRKYGN